MLAAEEVRSKSQNKAVSAARGEKVGEIKDLVHPHKLRPQLSLPNCFPNTDSMGGRG